MKTFSFLSAVTRVSYFFSWTSVSMGASSSSEIEDVLRDQSFLRQSSMTMDVRSKLDLSDDQLRKLWDSYDKDKSGVLDKNEIFKFVGDFCDALQKKELSCWDEVIVHLEEPQKSKVLARLPEEKKQTIGKYTVLKKLVPEIFQDFDKNRDGMVTFLEFKALLDDFDPGRYLTRHPELCEGVVDITRF